MTVIFPVPSGRTSDLLLQQRLLAQLRSEQRDLLQVQDQLSSGRRFILPSDDAPASFRALGLQRLLEQKDQIAKNVDASQSFLSAADSSLGSVADALIEIRGRAVSAVDVSSSDIERKAAAEEVGRSIQQLVQVGNRKFRDRYLFAGSQAGVVPFELGDLLVSYEGNEGHLRSLADLNLLVQSNAHGDEVFGTISSEVLGRVDLNPVLDEGTRLVDLRGGLGISPGSIVVSDGVNSRTIDLSNAETVGDVIRLLEAQPPPGRRLTVRLEARGLHVELDSAGGDALGIREVANGTTAADLGIFRDEGQGNGPIVGSDLDPRLTLTTPLASLLGVRARAAIESAGSDSNVVLESRARGTAGNGVRLQFVDDDRLQAAAGLLAGLEAVHFTDVPLPARAALPLSGLNNNLLLTGSVPGTDLNGVQIEVVAAGAIGDAAQVNFDAANRRLTIGIDSSGNTQVQTLIDAINLEATFTAAYDPSDAGDGGFVPTAGIPTSSVGVVFGNTGNSGAEANTILVHVDAGRTTSNHVVQALNADATISASFVARLDDKDALTVPGVGKIDIDATAVTRGGSGIEPDSSSGLRISNGEQTEVITLEDAETVEDLLNLFNGSGLHLLAQINDSGTGIDLRSRLSGRDLSIGENGGTTASELGLRSFTAETPLSELNYGSGVQVADGADLAIRRNDGVELQIDLSYAVTVGDVLDLINGHPDNLDPDSAVLARPAAVGNGIELVDDNPSGGNVLTVRRLPGSGAAWQLGLVPAGEEQAAAREAAPATATVAFAPPDDVNNQLRLTATQPGTAWNDVNVEFVSGVAVGDQALVAYDLLSRTLTVDIDPAATTANTVINALNAHGLFTATLDTTLDPTNDGSGQITQTGLLAGTGGGSADRLQGRDVNPVETNGIFNTLIRLQEALDQSDLAAVERAMGLLDEDFERLNLVRAEFGARQQSLDALGDRLQTENVELQSALSLEIDVDIVEAVSNLSARQASLEASLQLIGRMFQLSLLDFL